MNEADMYGTLEAAKKEGLEEGAKKKAKEIIQAMLKANLPLEQISKLTDLTSEEIDALKLE